MKEIEKLAMNKAIEESKVNAINNYKNGGPFGATIIKGGKIIASAHNTVVESKDATAHAEINAIRKASEILNTHDLSGCILYTSAEPCPMCLSAIIWANIKKVYYCNDVKKAENIGFRDDFIYDYIKNGNPDVLDLESCTTEKGLGLYDQYARMNKIIY